MVKEIERNRDLIKSDMIVEEEIDQKVISSMRLTAQGEITFITEDITTSNSAFAIDYQNTLGFDEFIDSEHKTFSLKEIENLL